MRLKHYHIIAVAAIFLGSSSLTAVRPSAAADNVQMRLTDFADEEAPAAVAEPPAVDESADIDIAETYEEFVGQSYGAPYISYEDIPYSPQLAVRFGWWGLDVSGSRTGVGEWMGLDNSAPFYDVDGLMSNGCQTLDFFLTGPENEANQAYMHFYGGPAFSMNLDYDRFIHRQGWDPILIPDGGAFGVYDPNTVPPTVPSTVLWGDDELPGNDYAIRVQMLDASFKGNLTQNIGWRVNVWGLKKDGLRQSNAVTHCANVSPPAGPGGSRCHVASQGQSIDWLTMEVEPVIEARFGWLTLEYSRTMRQFNQADELVFADYTGSDHATFGHGIGNYDMVPDNTTEIDRIKVSAELGCYTDLYATGFYGNTHNQFRETDRKFYGADVRLTNRSFDNLKITAYGKFNAQQNSEDRLSLDQRYPNFGEELVPGDPSTFYSYFHEVQEIEDPNNPGQTIEVPNPPYPNHLNDDRVWTSVGLNSRWTPFADYCDWRRGMAVVSGYEFRRITRNNADHTFNFVDGFVYDYNQGIPSTDPNWVAPATTYTAVPWVQPDSDSHRVVVGLEEKWSCTLSSYVRYKMVHTEYPLYGIGPATNSNLDDALNSGLPTHEDRFELGGTWTPTDNFMLTGQIWFENSYSNAPGVRFDQDRYPFLVSAWYAPTCQWSFTGGFAEFTDWINQDVTFGNNTNRARYQSGWYDERSVPFTDALRYTGRSDVITLGTAYAATNALRLSGGFEYVWGTNFFRGPSEQTFSYDDSRNYPVDVPENIVTETINYDSLPTYSVVRLQTYRLTGGIDYRLTCNINWFGRYNWYDWDDKSSPWNSGTAHMFLTGLSGVY